MTFEEFKKKYAHMAEIARDAETVIEDFNVPEEYKEAIRAAHVHQYAIDSNKEYVFRTRYKKRLINAFYKAIRSLIKVSSKDETWGHGSVVTVITATIDSVNEWDRRPLPTEEEFLEEVMEKIVKTLEAVE